MQSNWNYKTVIFSCFYFKLLYLKKVTLTLVFFTYIFITYILIFVLYYNNNYSAKLHKLWILDCNDKAQIILIICGAWCNWLQWVILINFANIWLLYASFYLLNFVCLICLADLEDLEEFYKQNEGLSYHSGNFQNENKNTFDVSEVKDHYNEKRASSHPVLSTCNFLLPFCQKQFPYNWFICVFSGF